MPSQIAPMDHEPVEIEDRRVMTYGEKHRRWEEVGRVCMICKLPCPPAGPGVIWDHRIPLGLGGTNDLANMEPNHTGECAARKTTRDLRAIAKAKRRKAKNEGTMPPSPTPMRGRNSFRRREQPG